ncbi:MULTISPECIES: hypothetical protein [Acinetobacter]|uniref:Uncharacterized protein n=1 Tax=Acinetobacter parvus DSM 16617 = CIP 108168 TaxID=981333 RepID=N8Q8Y6_9GAMM|nr:MULTISPECIES: hypothetical protein [Acinetobacter]ENU35231.1 hypothetical protein F988_02657 [Acinetobacter parvus DSM 16617 = CIP 108168]ENU83661.1 hypothetical protein F974_01213 [Acinetobacter sp. CIP 102159]ENU88051.1 hypothetical protein F972_02572 [Acinetobacter sp. CIP 102529]ENU95364.1 hypothetical protein F970_01828 [Acinetobacter sp. CIP 102082]ENX69878.1 hypothetical protein F884_00596 [Acinetobacter sp. CIP 102143]
MNFKINHKTDIDAEQLFQFILDNRLKITTHPLGFYCCRISTGASSDIRLHFWDKNLLSQESFTIHTHLFDLESYILYGSLKNTIFEYSKENKGLRCSVYQTSYNGNQSIIKDQETLSFLFIDSETIYNAGDTYSLKSHQAHKSELISPYAISLMTTLKHQAHIAYVFGTSELQDEKYIEYHRRELNQVECYDLITKFRKIINR